MEKVWVMVTINPREIDPTFDLGGQHQIETFLLSPFDAARDLQVGARASGQESSHSQRPQARLHRHLVSCILEDRIEPFFRRPDHCNRRLGPSLLQVPF